jgi:hypothetical protein
VDYLEEKMVFSQPDVSQLIKVADLEVLNFNLALNTPF